MAYDIDHPVFADIKNYFVNDQPTLDELNQQIQLINESPLFVLLLGKWEADQNTGIINYNDQNTKNIYDGHNILIHDISGTNFIRILGHELGHYFDERLDGTAVPEFDDTKKFEYLINEEMAESIATATSYIINRQILNATNDTDIGISNRVFDPTYGNNQLLLNSLDSTFGSTINSISTIDDLKSKVYDVAEMIWGNNFPLKKTPTDLSRWEKLLTAAFETDIPDFLQSSVRTFKQAYINQDGKYEFIFTEVYGGTALRDGLVKTKRFA